MKAPDKYPKSASNEIFLRYQIKSIFRIPMIATPAADPIIKTEPPVPAQYARNCQKHHPTHITQVVQVDLYTFALLQLPKVHYQQLMRANQ